MMQCKAKSENLAQILGYQNWAVTVCERQRRTQVGAGGGGRWSVCERQRGHRSVRMAGRRRAEGAAGGSDGGRRRRAEAEAGGVSGGHRSGRR